MYGPMRNPEFQAWMTERWPKADERTRWMAWEVWKRAYKLGVDDAPELARWAAGGSE